MTGVAATLRGWAELTCDHCGVAHVRVAVARDRCRCGGTGVVEGSDWVLRPCDECPGDGWRELFSGMDADGQMPACREAVVPRQRTSGEPPWSPYAEFIGCVQDMWLSA